MQGAGHCIGGAIGMGIGIGIGGGIGAAIGGGHCIGGAHEICAGWGGGTAGGFEPSLTGGTKPVERKCLKSMTEKQRVKMIETIGTFLRLPYSQNATSLDVY